MIRFSFLLALLAGPLGASSLLVAVPDRGMLLAADRGRITAFPTPSLAPAWSVDGVDHPLFAVFDDTGRRLAVLDPIEDRVAVLDLRGRSVDIHEVAGTPIAAAFDGTDLFVLARDSRRLVRIGKDGEIDSHPTEADPASILISSEGVLVYSRTSGRLERFDPATLRTIASADAARFASDLESDGRSGYLVLPREGRVDVFSLETLAVTEQRRAGAVPVDLSIERGRSALSSGRVAVADPSSKRIWRDEGSQGFGEAVARGFLRGILGLGLYSARSSSFPTGVDRLIEADGGAWAYDSSAGVLYRVGRTESAAAVAEVGWGEFAISGGRVYVLREGRIEALSLRVN